MKTTVEPTTLTKQSGVATGQPSFEVVDLGPFDNNRNDVQALNDRGQMAGVSLNAGTGRIEAFTQESGERKSLGTLGGSFSIARGINNNGEVVGGSLTEGDENFHGFLFRENRLYDLNQLVDPAIACELIQAFSINNRGVILGIGSLNGQDRIVLLRPRE
jgi:probable HAF family extracellular repeat protein